MCICVTCLLCLNKKADFLRRGMLCWTGNYGTTLPPTDGNTHHGCAAYKSCSLKWCFYSVLCILGKRQMNPGPKTSISEKFMKAAHPPSLYAASSVPAHRGHSKNVYPVWEMTQLSTPWPLSLIRTFRGRHGNKRNLGNDMFAALWRPTAAVRLGQQRRDTLVWQIHPLSLSKSLNSDDLLSLSPQLHWDAACLMATSSRQQALKTRNKSK